jgi:quinol monooxygenase YgiN
MVTPGRITVIASFKLLRGHESQWTGAYQEIMRKAGQDHTSGMHSARLFRDIRDDTHFTIISDWDSPDAFDRFVRYAGLIWEARGLEYAYAPAGITYLEHIVEGE